MSPSCPRHHDARLYLGPVEYQCDRDGGHTVRAADINHEFKPRTGAAR